VCLREVLCHLGWEILGRVLQRFPREVIQVRFDKSDDAFLIRVAVVPQDTAYVRLDEPLLATWEGGAVVEHQLGKSREGTITFAGEISERNNGGTALPYAARLSPLRDGSCARLALLRCQRAEHFDAEPVAHVPVADIPSIEVTREPRQVGAPVKWVRGVFSEIQSIKLPYGEGECVAMQYLETMETIGPDPVAPSSLSDSQDRWSLLHMMVF
jgi:hypothetical protein